MGVYVVRRVLQWIPVLVLSSMLIFAVVHNLPGDIADVLAGGDATPDVVAAIRAEYGLDRSLPVQYLDWAGHVVQGDFGTSYLYHRSNASLILGRLPYSLLLATTSLLLALLIGLPAGLYAGMRGGRLGDWIVSAATAAAVATPDFWFGLVAILVFAVALDWLPPGGFVGFNDDPWGFLLCLILPSFTLALHGAAVLARFTRSAVLETLGEDHVRTARAKGISPTRVLLRHVLRNALTPVATVLGLHMGTLLGGTVLVEYVFNWPGLSTPLLEAVDARDYPMVEGIVLVTSALFLLINLAMDLLYAVLDPRVRAA